MAIKNNSKIIKTIITDIVDTISKKYTPKKIILFGSYAYGEPAEDSDIDLFIIKNTNKRPIDRWIEVKRLLRDKGRMLAVSPIVYTEKEIEERLAIRDFFVEEVFEKGALLYG
jgi:predicted nucleotidyltransferase